MLEGAHPPLVSEAAAEAFRRWEEQTRARREAGTAHTRRNQHVYRAPYLLSGLLRCGRCGYTFHGSTRRRKGHAYALEDRERLNEQIEDVADDVAAFVISFRSIWEKASLIERKALLACFVKETVIDPRDRSVELVFYAVPKTQPAPVRCLASREPVTSATGSGGPTYVALVAAEDSTLPCRIQRHRLNLPCSRAR